MKNLSLFLWLFLTAPMICVAQTTQDSVDQNSPLQQNSAQRMLSASNGNSVTLGAYGEVVYNQPESDNGNLDVRRLVTLLSYQFNDKVQFFSEIEFEHVKEVFVEQAFISYNFARNINFRGGLMLIPMGIINEYHEPTTFNGVNRPGMDHDIVPTTWREIGVGFSGRINSASLNYQAYIFNGFQSTEEDGTGLLGGKSGLRGGRQKGIESTVNKPNFSVKLDYYGILGLRLGLSGYFGRTEAPDQIDKVAGADINVSMLGLDARYAYKRFSARGQLIYASLSDTEEYNDYTGRDLGSALSGWYTEAAFNLLSAQKKQKLIAFTRYENYDTHASTKNGLAKNRAYDRQDVTFGLSYHIAEGVVFKSDYQIFFNALENNTAKKQLNFGIGFWF